MNIAISSTGPDLDSFVDPRFGRAAYLLIFDRQTGTLLEAIDNSARVNTTKGAGIGVAALMADKGVETIITGKIGPKAMPIIEKANINVISNVAGSVQKAIEQFKQQGDSPALSTATQKNTIFSSTEPNNSITQGQGCGRGMGGGRGRGSGGGRGQGNGGRGSCRR